MKIGIIGSGNIGANVGRLFVRGGHEVALSNSRGGKGLAALVAELGGTVLTPSGLNIWRLKATRVDPLRRGARFSSPEMIPRRKRPWRD